MKTLYLLRHAKSSWNDATLSDHQRPLNKRGKNDSPKMGKWLLEHMNPPQRILCSDATRTRDTIALVLQAWNLPLQLVQYNSLLYHASPKTLLQQAQECPDNIDCLLLVGHNPGITEFANNICREFHIENIPTCGFAAFSFPVQHWQEIKAGEATFETYQFPKNI